MKSSLRLAAVLIALTLPVICQGLAAQRSERTVTREFKYTSGTTLNIDSKFGNINILNSDDNSITVVATLWANSDNKKLSDDLAGKLDAQISESGTDISISSVFPDKLPSRDNTQFGIDFTIHAPAAVAVNLKNRYGAVYIEDLSGLAMIDVSYGNLKAGSLSRGKENTLNEVNLSYSTGSISSVSWLKISLAYSKLNISEATALVALSKYSGLNLEECSSLVVESKYDTYKISELKNYVGDLRYSNLSADEIAGKFEITSSYSVVKVDEIGGNFESIKIDNTRGSYKLGISGKSSFTIEGEAKRGDISVDGIENLNKRVENDDKYISGSYGSNPKSTVNVVSTEGSVKIKVD